MSLDVRFCQFRVSITYYQLGCWWILSLDIMCYSFLWLNVVIQEHLFVLNLCRNVVWRLVFPWPLCSRIYCRDQWTEWHAVASWTWDAQDETCGICRMAFDGCCPDCKLPGDDCPLIWGACNHAFHLHCILKWVNSQTPQAHCPMCRREWQFKGWV